MDKKWGQRCVFSSEQRLSIFRSLIVLQTKSYLATRLSNSREFDDDLWSAGPNNLLYLALFEVDATNQKCGYFPSFKAYTSLLREPGFVSQRLNGSSSSTERRIFVFHSWEKRRTYIIEQKHLNFLLFVMLREQSRLVKCPNLFN